MPGAALVNIGDPELEYAFYQAERRVLGIQSKLHRWAAAAGAVIGAVAGAFAPSIYDGVRARGIARQRWLGTVEPPVPRSRARLLDPRLELVGFVGRDAELAALNEWCEDDHATRLRLVTGTGGVGKTRLAVELAARMANAGWRCERIADGKEGEALAALRGVTRDRALLVVDYAETRIGLRQMLTALTSDDGAGVKVLLLARSAGECWDQLGVEEPAMWDLVQAAQFPELSSVIDANLSDADVVAQAVKSFARKLGLPEKVVQIYGDRGGRRRVLDLHAAALVAVLDEANTGMVRVDIRTVLGELLRHEQHFWYDSAHAYGLSNGPAGIPARMLRQLVAAGCLLGAATEAEARDLPGRIPGLSPSARVAGWLRELYPSGGGEPDWLGSLQPDRLAELHIVRELVASPELAEACLTNLDGRQARRAVTLLAGASSDDPDAEALLSRALPNVAGFIVDLVAPREKLTAIFNAIPYPTVILASAAVVLAERIITLLPDDTQLAERAYWSYILGVWLSELGRPADALPRTQEAVTTCRELAAASPDRYRPDLARSLTNLAELLVTLERKADAAAARIEATKFRPTI